MGKTIFWAVDCQRDFMLPTGKLYVKGAEEIIPNLDKLTNYAKNKGLTVVNTADWHSKSSKELSDKPDFKTTFPPHCMIGEEGSDFINETYPKTLKRGYYILNHTDATINSDNFLFGRVKDIIILKDAFDVFEGNILAHDMVEFLNPDEIIVYGVATNVCVDKAVRGLAVRGFNVKVVVDAIKELPNIELDSIFNLWSFMGVDFITTEDILQRK